MGIRATPRGPSREAVVLAAVVVVLVLAVLPSCQAATGPLPAISAPPVRTPPAHSGPPSNVISDGGSISVTSPVASTLTDTVSYGATTNGSRTYTVTLRATVALPSVTVDLETSPIVQWGYPQQMPGGDDSLPPIALWNWTVLHNGTNDSAHWKETSWSQILNRTTTWTNGSWLFVGTTAPTVTVAIYPDTPGGSNATSPGVVINLPGVAAGLPTNDPNYTRLTSAIQPGYLRFSTYLAQVSNGWNNATGTPKYNFTHLDALIEFASAVGAKVVLSLPAGSWGNGNNLPPGMPVNTSLVVTSGGESGYFPNLAAYAAYVGGVVNHTVAADESVGYWSIGNEVPTSNASVVAGFTNVFNVAAHAIHRAIPSARVGADDMTNTTYEAYFAAHAVGVGFLSFHDYPAVGLCVRNGTYCPPAGPPNGSTSQGMFSHSAYAYMGGIFPPGLAQQLWHNLTGAWLPVLDTESNLNGFGGTPGTAALGTDPRIQTLFGASWIDSFLIDSSVQNISGVLYFTLSSSANASNTDTGPYGGWGFGLTAEGPGGQDVRYAPYYALELWSEAIPAHAPSVRTNSSAPNVVYDFAARDGPNLSVVLVSRVNVPVGIAVQVRQGAYTLASVSTLDQRSYVETYEPSQDQTVLSKAGYITTHPANNSTLLIDGYGVAVAHYVPSGSDGTGNSTGNSTGGGGGSSSGNSTGNSTGGGSGNSTGNSTGGGNPTGNSTGNTTGNSTGSGAGSGNATGGGNSTGTGSNNSTGNSTTGPGGNTTSNGTGKGGSGNDSGTGGGGTTGGGPNGTAPAVSAPPGAPPTTMVFGLAAPRWAVGVGVVSVLCALGGLGAAWGSAVRAWGRGRGSTVPAPLPRRAGQPR